MGEELRLARVASGLSQSSVARVAGVSHSTVGRVERGRLPGVSIDVIGRLAATLGLDLVVRVYPRGDPVRDAAHVALLGRLRRRLPAGTTWQTEVPLPLPGDLRAWDAVIGQANDQVAVEAETRLLDIQAVERRILLKQRDGRMARVVVLVSDTAPNRRALAAGREHLRGSFPLDTHEILSALRSGRLPIASGIVIA